MRAVLFDIDDTLVDFRGADAAGFGRYLAELRPQLTTAHTGDAERSWQRWGDHFFGQFTAGRLDFAEQRRRRARAFCGEQGLDLAAGDAAADEWFGGYLRHCEQAMRAFPDALPALVALRAAGLRVGAVSNSAHANQDRRLRLVGLRDRLDALVCCDDVGGIGKPDARIFHAGCDALGVAPRDTYYIGDNLDLDARAADAAGLTGYWLNRRAAAAPAGVCSVSTLDEFVRLLMPVPEEVLR
jgi:putative hydrolase of the HAD superfamily